MLNILKIHSQDLSPLTRDRKNLIQQLFQPQLSYLLHPSHLNDRRTSLDVHRIKTPPKLQPLHLPAKKSIVRSKTYPKTTQ